jgi:hypothetical protein
MGHQAHDAMNQRLECPIGHLKRTTIDNMGNTIVCLVRLLTIVTLTPGRGRPISLTGSSGQPLECFTVEHRLSFWNGLSGRWQMQ